jgi:hypothetical protein
MIQRHQLENPERLSGEPTFPPVLRLRRRPVSFRRGGLWQAAREGDHGAAKLEHQAAAEIEPQSTGATRCPADGKPVALPKLMTRVPFFIGKPG